MRSIVRRATIAAVLAIVATGCSGDATSSDTPDPVLSVDVPTATFEPTAPSPGPSGAPSGAPTMETSGDLAGVADDGDVTVAEGQAVVDGHLDVYNPPVLAVLQSQPAAVPDDLVDAIFAIYDETWGNINLDLWIDDVSNDFAGLRTDAPTGVVEDVEEVVEVADGCFVVRMAQDFGGVSAVAGDPAVVWVRFEAAPDANPTGWIRTYEAIDEPSGGERCDGGA